MSSMARGSTPVTASAAATRVPSSAMVPTTNRTRLSGSSVEDQFSLRRHEAAMRSSSREVRERGGREQASAAASVDICFGSGLNPRLCLCRDDPREGRQR